MIRKILAIIMGSRTNPVRIQAKSADIFVLMPSDSK